MVVSSLKITISITHDLKIAYVRNVTELFFYYSSSGIIFDG